MQRGENALLHAGAHLEALGDHDGLREEVVRELLVERQVEANGAAADIERPVLDVGVGLQDRLEIIDHFARRIDRRPLRQRDIDEQLGTIGAREELLLHELHADECRNEQACRASDDGVLHAQNPIEHGVESARKARWLVAMALQLVGKNEHAGQRREQHGDDPGGNERDRHDREQREAILAGAACREADRDEAGDGHERARQHREGGGCVGEGRGSDLVVALLELGDHRLDRDHGVVDQKSEPDDERAERDALQADAGQLHDHEGDGENQRDGDGDDDAGTPAERQEAHAQHDGDGLDQRLDELADGLLDDVRLVCDEMRLDADRQVRGQLGEPLLHVLAERQHIGVLGHRDGEADRRRAVVAEHRLLRVDVGAADFGDVAQAKEPAVDAEVDGLEALFRRELAGDADRDLLGACIDGAAGLDGVLRLQRLYQLGNVEPHGGELLGGELQVDLLVLRADEIDLGNVRNAAQLATQTLGMVAQLAMRKAVRGQGEDERIGVAELVVEERTLHALRQRLLDVADLLARLIPEIRHLGRGRRVLEGHEHHGLAGLGVALQIVEVRQLLELLLDAVGDLLHGFQRRGAGPQRLHHHGLDGERRVLLAAELADTRMMPASATTSMR